MAEPAELSGERAGGKRRAALGGGARGRPGRGRRRRRVLACSRLLRGGKVRRRSLGLAGVRAHQRFRQSIERFDLLLHLLPALLRPLEPRLERLHRLGQLLLLALRELEVLPQGQELGLNRVNLDAHVGGLLAGLGRAVVQVDRLLAGGAFRLALQALGLGEQPAALAGGVLGLLLELADLLLERRQPLIDGLEPRQRAGLVLLPDRVLRALDFPAVLFERGALLGGLKVLESGDNGGIGLEPRRQTVDLGNEPPGGELFAAGAVEQRGGAPHLRLGQPRIRLRPHRRRGVPIGRGGSQRRRHHRQLALRRCVGEALVDLLLHLPIGPVGRVITPGLHRDQAKTDKPGEEG